MHSNIVDHAKSFADFLESHVATIHEILRKYQSKEVVDDEVRRSLETLRHIREIEQYFSLSPLSQKTASFLPLNLPLYSFVLFAAMPAYQSVALTIRPPQRMQELFTTLFNVLSFKDYYPNIDVFAGSRSEFLSSCCRTASVVIFTGKYENSLLVRKICSKNTLVLYSGVGHNPLVITPSADIDLAVEKTLQVKMFNSGQDCAGPDIILVHSLVANAYLERLLERLSCVKCGCSYADDVVVGPLFETSSLLNVAKLLSEMSEQGAKIHYGGQLDLKHNVVYPCVVKASLRQMQNFRELYSPVLVVTEYECDQELSLYFDDANARYQLNEMYVSLFGESEYVSGKQGSIILRNCTVQDAERGTEEYGGYSPGASSVSYQGISSSKPILIPREIQNFLSQKGQRIFASIPQVKGNWLRQVISTQFQETVQQIFGDQLAFAYIFGSCATEDGKRYSDIDTLICVYSKQAEQIERYLEWLFFIHEMFGRIPDFKYPSEIVTLSELQTAVAKLPTLELSASPNKAEAYDTMVWCHSLSQPWTGEVRDENVPDYWKTLFPSQSLRILQSFLRSLESTIASGDTLHPLTLAVHEIPRQEPELSLFLKNLSNRGLIDVLKMIPFEERPIYSDIVLRLVAGREFMGRSMFSKRNVEHLFHPCFRFGVVTS